MKYFILIFCTALTLQAGFFERDTHRSQLQKRGVFEQFKQNASEANAIVKRGEFDRITGQEAAFARIQAEVASLDITAPERDQLSGDLATYGELVHHLGTDLKQNAPKLNAHYEQVLGGLSEFNRRMGSIGLFELLHSWRELSRIKSRFVKKPNARLVKAFDKEWTNITITITELYLDEDMEKPLFDYLDAYKAYFNELSGAYRSVGYAEVAKLKPLTYKIKMQFEMIMPRLAKK
jgi:hypothetical protein